MQSRTFLFALGAVVVASCAQDPVEAPSDIAIDEDVPELVDAGDDAGDGARDAHDGADDAADADDLSDARDASDAVSRWDIILPDVVDAAMALDATGAEDVVARPDIVAVDQPRAEDRPDVVTLDRPDVVAPRPDVVTVDRPDVVAPRPDVVTIDRPDVVTVDRPDVVTVDRPDVVAPRPDVVTVDRPDVVTVDAGPGVPPPDPVAYGGTFPVRTGVFNVTLTVVGERRTVRLAVPTTPVASPPLVMLFHGTNGDGGQIMTEANAAALANAQGVIVAAPTSRWLPVGDFDHASAETYWETQNNPFPNANQDVILARAIMVEAQRVYRVDPARIYAMGHSNGGYFALFLSSLLQDRIAAFAVNSSGLVTCARTLACGFQGAGTTCATLATRPGWCRCTGPELPIPLPTSGRRVPGYITHGTADPLVSVYYACTLQSRMTALGMPVQISLYSGEGHVIPTNWVSSAWAFFRSRRL